MVVGHVDLPEIWGETNRTSAEFLGRKLVSTKKETRLAQVYKHRPPVRLIVMNSDSDELNQSKIPIAQPYCDNQFLGPNADDLSLVGSIYAGRYQIDSVLGAGGMGVVYKGHQVFLDRPVAIKLLRSGSIPARAQSRFHFEAKAASKLDHPGIVSVIDFGVDDSDRPYMVLEYVDGCSLAELLEERVILPVEDVLPIFLEVCDALAFAHKRGVVHRDLKPGNIMLVAGDEGELRTKILDFGNAKTMDLEDDTLQDLTKSGNTLGTPLYMSPEQINSRSVTYRSDLYSLGCTLYACLTGSPPFIGENEITTMQMHCNDRPRSLEAASGGINFPARIEGIVFRLLEKNPKDRFESASHLKIALSEFGREHGLMNTTQ